MCINNKRFLCIRSFNCNLSLASELVESSNSGFPFAGRIAFRSRISIIPRRALERIAAKKESDVGKCLRIGDLIFFNVWPEIPL